MLRSETRPGNFRRSYLRLHDDIAQNIRELAWPVALVNGGQSQENPRIELSPETPGSTGAAYGPSADAKFPIAPTRSVCARRRSRGCRSRISGTGREDDGDDDHHDEAPASNAVLAASITAGSPFVTVSASLRSRSGVGQGLAAPSAVRDDLLKPPTASPTVSGSRRNRRPRLAHCCSLSELLEETQPCTVFAEVDLWVAGRCEAFGRPVVLEWGKCTTYSSPDACGSVREILKARFVST